MTSPHFLRCISELSLKALKRSHRQIVVLQGKETWANELFSLITSSPFSNEVQTATHPINTSLENNQAWYIYSDGDNHYANVNKQTFKNKLGSESQFVVFYSDQLNIDALAALSGTLIAGGILFIVVPENVKHSNFFEQSFFNQRFVSKLTNDTSIHLIKEGDDIAPEELFEVANNEVSQDITEYLLEKKLKHEMGCLTEEQFVAVKHVMQVVKGHRNRPLILTADRGRGKSSALAIACAELLMTTHEGINIAITAPHKNSLDVFFSQLRSSLKLNGVTEKANNTIHQLEHKNGTIEFIAIDELIKTPTRFNLVLVDEAASIPLFFLNQLLTKFHRMVFASTVHGYEGAGRSFTLKFQKHIKKQYPQGKTFNIRQPIRWADNDPVEAFINDLCLLDAEPPVLSKDVSLPHVVDRDDTLSQPSLFVFKQVTTEQLIADEVLLKQVFAVLVTAHYQTSPNDLRLLLDNENISLVTLSFKEQLLGVALLLKEGTSKNEHIKSLLQTNQRRLKDQFLPQSLLTHCGEENSFNFSYLRVMRIAIVPEFQHRGLGSLFLSKIEGYALQENIDFIGSSFGANQALLSFWQQQGYKIARIGFTKDKASGEHSALLLKAINNQHIQYLNNIEVNFYQSFDYLLAEQYQALLPELVWQIMTYCPESALPSLNVMDIKAVEDFYTKKRQYSVCVFHLHRWLQHQMKKPYEPNMAPVINKIFQRKDVSTLCSLYGFTGKKAFNTHLIEFVQHLYKK